MPIIPEFESCSKMTRAFHSHENGSAAVDTLYEYAKRNLLWLNVYVKVFEQHYSKIITTPFSILSRIHRYFYLKKKLLGFQL